MTVRNLLGKWLPEIGAAQNPKEIEAFNKKAVPHRTERYTSPFSLILLGFWCFHRCCGVFSQQFPNTCSLHSRRIPFSTGYGGKEKT